MPAETLHESEGLRIWRNERNRFCIARLHYTADPAKRSSEWRQEAQAGMNPARWALEYEIEWNALGGTRVFPEITLNRRSIVVAQPYPEFPPTQSFFGGFDYGARNPSSMHFYTIWDGVIYSIWELYEPCKNIHDFIAKVKAFPYYNRVRWIAADPAVVNTRNTRNSKGLPCTMNELFIQAGLTKLIAGNNDEQLWVASMRKHWSDPEDPSFRIFDCCAAQIKEFEGAVYPNSSEAQLQTSNYRETILDRNNHAMDDCKYFMNNRPRETTSNVKMPELWKKWMVKY